MFVASSSHLEDFLSAFSSLAQIASNFSPVSTVCSCQSFLYSYDAVAFSLLTKFVVVVVLRMALARVIFAIQLH
jgi:hypothetical protein